MDASVATIISAVVTAAGGLIGKLVERGGRSAKADPASDKKAAEVADSLYDSLRRKITDSCFKVILFHENGQNKMPLYTAKNLYDLSSLSREIEDLFMREFTYRLEYLRMLGMLTMVYHSEYTITRLGSAFLAEARRRRDYYSILFPSQN